MHLLIDENKNKTANLLLKALKLYSSDHHSRAIYDLMPEFINRYLGELYPYLDSRIMQDEQVKTISKAYLKESFKGVTSSELWFNEEPFFEKIEPADEKDCKIENNIKCEFLDLPFIF